MLEHQLSHKDKFSSTLNFETKIIPHRTKRQNKFMKKEIIIMLWVKSRQIKIGNL